MMIICCERVKIITDENGRLAKEQPELNELKRQHVHLRVVRQRKAKTKMTKMTGQLVTGVFTGLVTHIINYK